MMIDEPSDSMVGNGILEQFSNVEPLDDGDFGTVYKAKFLSTGEWVALKQIKFRKEEFEPFHCKVSQEVKVWKRAKHANIAHYTKHWYTDTADLLNERLLYSVDPEHRNLWIEMELYACNLRTWMSDKFIETSFFWGKAWRIFEQLLEAVEYCEKEGILHRDVKPENIFIDFNDSPKLGDFGLSKHVGDQTTGVSNSLVVHPTQVFRAPELMVPESSITSKVDVFSTGLVLLFLFSRGSSPGERDMVLARAAHIGEFPKTTAFIFQHVFELVQWMISKKPEDRPLASEIRNSDSYRYCQTELSGALEESSCSGNLHQKALLAASSSSSSVVPEALDDRCQITSEGAESSPAVKSSDGIRTIAHFTPLLTPKDNLQDPSVGIPDNEMFDIARKNSVCAASCSLDNILLRLLKEAGPAGVRTKDLVHKTESIDETFIKKVVNYRLYDLEKEKKVKKIRREPPTWSIC